MHHSTDFYRWELSLVAYHVSFPFLGVKTWAKKIKEQCSCKFVMFIIAILGLIVSIVGILVPVLTTRHVQPHQNSSGMAISD